MAPDAAGDSSRLAHQKILEEEQGREDHVIDFFPIF